MIDDIIEFVDNEDEEGVIIFVDQEKAFDRMEWEWLNYVMLFFNFGLIFREWVYMLFKRGKTCIKTWFHIIKFRNIAFRQTRMSYCIDIVHYPDRADGLYYPKHSGNTLYPTTRL